MNASLDHIKPEARSPAGVKLEALKRHIMAGMADVEAGRYKTYASGREVFDDIKTRGRQRIASQPKTKR
jgi:hypothetical protein